MPRTIDGPASARFRPVLLPLSPTIHDIPKGRLSDALLGALGEAPRGDCVCWGIPFAVAGPVVADERPAELPLGVTAGWLVFLHATDSQTPAPEGHRAGTPWTGEGRLAERAADYVVRYEDGHEERLAIMRRRQIGACCRRWGECCFEAVAHRKPHPVHAHHEQTARGWGWSQTRVDAADQGPWLWWLWAWQNPRPEAPIRSLRVEPASGAVLLAAISAGDASSNPLRWRTRRKAVLRLAEPLDGSLDEAGVLRQVSLDLGQVISATPQPAYPVEQWERSYNNQLPAVQPGSVLLEYAAHEDACFHLASGETIAVSAVENTGRKTAGARPPGSHRFLQRPAECGCGWSRREAGSRCR